MLGHGGCWATDAVTPATRAHEVWLDVQEEGGIRFSLMRAIACELPRAGVGEAAGPAAGIFWNTNDWSCRVAHISYIPPESTSMRR